MAKASLAATSQTSSSIMSFSITLVEAVHCQTQSQGIERLFYLTLKRKHGISMGRGGEGGERAFGEQPSDMLCDCPHPPPAIPSAPVVTLPCSHPSHCLTSPHFSQHLILLGPLSYLPHMPLQSANCPSCPGLVTSQSITPRATSCRHNLISLSSSSSLSVLYYRTRVMCLAPSWHREIMDGRNCAVFRLCLTRLLSDT